MGRHVGRTLRDVRPADRKNPKSIRRLLYQWICDEYGRDVARATAAVNASRPPPGVRNSRRHPVANDAYYHVINDDTHLQYYQVEAVARHHNAPIAALLLFTRTQSELARFGYGDARKLLSEFRAFADGLAALIEESAAHPALEPDTRAEILDYAAFKALTLHFPKAPDDEELETSGKG